MFFSRNYQLKCIFKLIFCVNIRYINMKLFTNLLFILFIFYKVCFLSIFLKQF